MLSCYDVNGLIFITYKKNKTTKRRCYSRFSFMLDLVEKRNWILVYGIKASALDQRSSVLVEILCKAFQNSIEEWFYWGN